MSPTTTTVADDLQAVADLVRGGMPAPISIIPARSGHPTSVQVTDADLDAWLNLLEVEQPEWSHDGHARWSAFAFAGQPFVLRCCRSTR